MATSSHRSVARKEVMEGYVYVVDTRNCYLGRVGLRELVISDPADTAKAIMKDSRLCVMLETDREEVARLDAKLSSARGSGH